MKKRFTILIAALMLLTMMASTGTMWGQSYTISLKDNGTESDASSSMGYSVSSAYVSNYVDVTDNLDYVYTISFNNYVYKAKTNHGWKLSSSSKLGRFVLNLTTTAQALTVSKVTVNAKNYGTDETSLVVTITKTDNTTQNQTFVLTSDFSDYELTLTSVSTIKSIQVETNANSKKRAYVHHITVTCPSTGPTQLDTPDNFSATPGNGKATFTWDAVENASSYTISYTTDGETWTDIDGIDETSFTKTDLDNDTEYTCKIKAVGDDEDYSDSEYSETINVTPTGATFYTISIDNGIENGSVEASASSATEGTSITLTPTADAGYDFDAWNVYKTGDQATPVTVTINAFNMPAYDVTVSATFTEKTKYTITKVATNGTVTTDATNDKAYEGQVVSLTLTPNSGYEFSSLTVVDADGDVVTVTNNQFTMPGKAVTVTATFAREAEWILTDISELTSEDVFVIVGTISTTNYTIINTTTAAAPKASTVNISDNKISGTPADNVKWNISGNSDDGFIFYPNGTTENWLYSNTTANSSANNNIRIGNPGNNTNRNLFVLDNSGYLKTNYTNSRYISYYSTDNEWRAYLNTSNNPGVFTFYKRTVPSSVATPTFSVAEGTYKENQSVTITCATDGAAIYYTLDGTKPTSSSTAYTGAITIDETKTLKAIAIKNNEESYVASATYTMQCATPTFSIVTGTYTSVQSVTITSTAEASIYYTLDGTTPTGSSTPYSGAIRIDETKTLKAIAIKSNWENSEVASASYTIYLPLTTIDEIYASSATSDTYAITFDDWVVSGIQTGNPSKKAYVTDGEKGFAIYNSDGHGLSAGDVLSGTVICSLSRYNGSAQVSNISGTLNHNTGGEVTVANIALAELSGINTGALISYNDLSYNGTNLSDGNINIKPFGDLTPLSGLFTSGNKYHVKGIYLQYSATKEIMPRSSADVVLAADLVIAADLMPFSYIVEGPSDEQNIDVICTDLGSNILTATASSDYEISLAQDGPYTQSVEMTPEDGGVLASVYVRLRADLLVGEHNGTVTFTATNLTTATVNVTGLVTETQTYDIVLDDVVNGTISADPMLVEAGETVTLTATPDDCYQFVKWVTEPEVDWVSDNQFTMPAEPVLVSATFEQKTFVVTYSFNGKDISSTSPINCGETTNLLDEDDLTTLEVVIPSGFYFQGWSEEEGSNTLLSSPYTPTATRTLYAVLTYGESEAYYARVTSDLGTNWAGDYLIAYSSTVFADGRVGGKDDVGAIGKANVKVNLSSYISGNNIPATNGDTYKVTLEKIENSNTYVLKTQDGKYNYQTTNSNGLVATTTKSTAANYPITVMFTSENDIKLCLGGSANGAVFRYNDGNGGTSDAFFRFYKDGGQNAVYLYKRTVSEVPNFNKVVNVANSQSMSENISESMCVIVENNGILTFSGENQGTAENLVIEDGGQLITKSSGVNATVKKNIEQATNWGTGTSYDADGWYFIASPVNGAAFPTGTVANQDIFQLDWANNKWLNLQYSGNSALLSAGFQRGTGYLYASKEGNTISVAGVIQPLSNDNTATVTLANDGWNLIGNPLTCKVTVDCAFSELVNASAVTNKAEGNAINPFQGIAVYGEEGDEVTFTKATTQNAVAPSNNNSLQMTLAKTITSRGDVSTKVVDNAVVSFKESKCMPKFNMIGGNTKLFIPQDDEEYSVVFSDRQGDVPLYFKANETGTYTISFAGDEMSLNGIYLIDILAEEEIDLSVNQSYTFIGSPADRMARFKIVFRNTGGDGTSDIFAYQNGNDIIVSGEGELQIFDVMGRMVSRQRVNGVETVNAMPYGVYIFKLNGMTQKIVVR